MGESELPTLDERPLTREEAEKLLRSILYYVEMWEDGDSPFHSLGHIATLINKEYGKERVALARVSGALVDAATVVVEPYDQGIRQLTAERDAYRSTLADMVADMPNARERAIDLLKNGPAMPSGGNDA